MLFPMCRASATSACLAGHTTHARGVVTAEAATATATTTTARWAHMLIPEAAWASTGRKACRLGAGLGYAPRLDVAAHYPQDIKPKN
jgi:hypothetical protein